MNKVFFIFVFLLASIVSLANSLFDPEKVYLITSNDLKKGGIEPSTNGTYPLIYNTDASEKRDKALWIITEEKPERYSFKNSHTGQYIQYDASNTSGKFIKMANKLNGDLTLFIIKHHKKENNIIYWTIAPASNPKTTFDRRKYNAVGPYQTSNNDNQLFSFKEKKGNYVQQPSLVNTSNGYLKSFTLNNIELIYDKASKTYYYPIPIKQMNGGSIKKTIHYIPQKPGYKIKIEKQNITSGATYTFNGITAQKIFEIQISENNNIIQTAKLIFTGLPIVQLYTEGNKWNTRFSPGKFKVTENDKAVTGEVLNADIRHRGASALSYSKKSFAIKLKDENRKSVDRSYFGLRNDNYWILDAMASDASRMRNRICTDLWNDYSSDPYYKGQEKSMINGTRGQFIEVFIDNQYWGLYCMTERIDRKQLKLKKYKKEPQSIHGVLYKSIQWSNSTMMGRMKGGSNSIYSIPKYDNNVEKWDRFEVKYPDLGDKDPITWKPLSDVISFVSKSDNSTFKKQIANNIDFPVWLDFYLFLDLIYAQDNHGKNVYLYIYDISKEKKIGLTPWDLDGTWGRNWDRTKTNAKGNFLHFTQAHYAGEHHIYRRLRETNAENYNVLLKKRYNELKGTHFSKNNLAQRLDNYLNLFTISGAKEREEARWNNANNLALQIDDEVAYMKKWISDRVNFLNKQYK
ncbi:CotH kinase family protein [Bacteroidales bacterium OttesenSCG-928-M06]|nr:CotH kinase family protein [Bacteroidales bacterium OttesenSCG-928-M06]